ncbi:pilus assembly protein PilP [Desulfonatronospira sp.]|uniref:pilus assembly protein PilP n=1 Tax=Desulfonatronospira sp. TaxID=1962951 RepID=UPI0025BDA000|nr:pilus assembly protein PilP [Desulfonatronospira sp.]
MAIILTMGHTTPTQADEQSPPEPDWMQVEAPQYSPEGLQDPFVPFVMPEEPPDTLPAMERLRPLTPLERVELGQLRLVGTIKSPEQEVMAMVELPDGKGVMLHKGTRIGPNQGEVVEIHPDRVVVREYIQGVYGIQETLSSLKLRPGGESD